MVVTIAVARDGIAEVRPANVAVVSARAGPFAKVASGVRVVRHKDGMNGGTVLDAKGPVVDTVHVTNASVASFLRHCRKWGLRCCRMTKGLNLWPGKFV